MDLKGRSLKSTANQANTYIFFDSNAV